MAPRRRLPRLFLSLLTCAGLGVASVMGAMPSRGDRLLSREARALDAGTLWVPPGGDDGLEGSSSGGYRLRVAGVWVPRPTTATAPGEYLGDLGREVLQRLILAGRLRLGEVHSPDGATRWVRVVVLEPRSEGSQDTSPSSVGTDVIDLAVFLARHGLALCDRPTAFDRDHAAAVCGAEREARRWRRGLHDGGFGARALEVAAVVDLGPLAPSESPVETANGAGGGRGEARSEASAVPAEGTWWTRTDHLEYLPPIE